MIRHRGREKDISGSVLRDGDRGGKEEKRSEADDTIKVQKAAGGGIRLWKRAPGCRRFAVRARADQLSCSDRTLHVCVCMYLPLYLQPIAE